MDEPTPFHALPRTDATLSRIGINSLIVKASPEPGGVAPLALSSNSEPYPCIFDRLAKIRREMD